MHILTALGPRAIPLAVTSSPGQRHDSLYVWSLLDAVRIGQRRGRPRQRPQALAGDKSYSSRGTRSGLWRRHIRPVIPERDDQRQHRHGRPPRLDKAAYRQRCGIERRIGWLKEYRRLATRYEKLAQTWEADWRIAMIQVYLKILFPNTA